MYIVSDISSLSNGAFIKKKVYITRNISNTQFDLYYTM